MASEVAGAGISVAAPDETTVIVTGAGSGIGYALTGRLLRDGYHVAACDRSLGRLSDAAHASLTFYRNDVTDRDAVFEVVERTAKNAPPIRGLVCCAAVFKTAPFLELDERMWDETFAVNVSGTLFSCQAALPHLRQAGGGSIVLFSSMAARRGSVKGGHYAATKGALLGFARSLALEVAENDIRVNTVSPGITDTPQPRGNLSDAEFDARISGIPLGRVGQPEDMVEATMFLLEEESAFITGQDIRVNGGSGLF